MKCKNSIPILLSEDVLHILNCIENAGHEARIVGGAVRNWLLGYKKFDGTDVDFATTATPQQLVDIFDKVIPSGLEHGTVTLVYNSKEYEITTLREDVKTFGRKASVVFCKSFELDSNRRDFTMNAIYMDKYGNIYDYHGGILDIRAKKVRFIGDPRKRICEDFLRMLRYFRFVAYYGDFKCSNEYLETINGLTHEISKLSSERILGEISKILILRDAYRIIPSMNSIMQELFGIQGDFAATILRLCNEEPVNGILSVSEKLSLILKFSDRNLEDLIRRYRFSKHTKQLLRLRSAPERKSNDIASTKKYLKSIRKEYRRFYLVYWITRRLVELKDRSEQSKLLKEFNELKSFCESGLADFSFRASSLTRYNLSEQALKEVMRLVKLAWLQTERGFSESDYMKDAARAIYSLKSSLLDR